MLASWSKKLAKSSFYRSRAQCTCSRTTALGCSLRACKAVGARLAGVDLIETANGLEIIEVNTGGEFKGLASTTDVDIAGAIVEEAVRTALVGVQ